jgi:hypothetical protein
MKMMILIIIVIIIIILTIVSRDSAVGTATVVQAGRSVVRIPLRLRFFSYPKRPDQQWVPPSFVFRVTAVAFQNVGTLAT